MSGLPATGWKGLPFVPWKMATMPPRAGLRALCLHGAWYKQGRLAPVASVSQARGTEAGGHAAVRPGGPAQLDAILLRSYHLGVKSKLISPSGGQISSRAHCHDGAPWAPGSGVPKFQEDGKGDAAHQVWPRRTLYPTLQTPARSASLQGPASPRGSTPLAISSVGLLAAT